LLVVVWFGLRLLRFQTLRRILGCHAGPTDGPSDSRPMPAQTVVGRVAWAVTAAARQLPASMNCLVKAVAADAMLRRRGFASELHFGVRESGHGVKRLDAHAWVECHGEVVVGAIERLSNYAVLSAPGHS